MRHRSYRRQAWKLQQQAHVKDGSVLVIHMSDIVEGPQRVNHHVTAPAAILNSITFLYTTDEDWTGLSREFIMQTGLIESATYNSQG